jgi:hypothetical protein
LAAAGEDSYLVFFSALIASVHAGRRLQLLTFAMAVVGSVGACVVSCRSGCSALSVDKVDFVSPLFFSASAIGPSSSFSKVSSDTVSLALRLHLPADST